MPATLMCDALLCGVARQRTPYTLCSQPVNQAAAWPLADAGSPNKNSRSRCPLHASTKVSTTLNKTGSSCNANLPTGYRGEALKTDLPNSIVGYPRSSGPRCTDVRGTENTELAYQPKKLAKVSATKHSKSPSGSPQAKGRSTARNQSWGTIAGA